MADVQLIGEQVTGSDTGNVYVLPSNTPDCYCDILLSAPNSDTNVWDNVIEVQRSTDGGNSWHTISTTELDREVGTSTIHAEGSMLLTGLGGNRIRLVYNVGGNNISLYVTVRVP